MAIDQDFQSKYFNEDSQLTSQGVAQVAIALEILTEVCFLNSKNHGWYDQHTDTEDLIADGYIIGEHQVLRQRNFGEVMALITSEVSEAFEAYRDGDDQTRISYGYKISGEPYTTSPIPEMEGILGKPEGIAAELADVLIRVFDYCGAYNVPIVDALIRKHAYNVSRPYRHGGKLA